jgi:transcriptional regulator with XRE-family HTH domain
MATLTKNTIGDIPAPELELLCRKISEGKEAGRESFKRLRQASGMSQRAAGAVVGRSAVSVCDWEAAGRGWPASFDIMPRLLEAFGCSVKILAAVYGTEYDERLEARAYLDGDPLLIEADWYNRHRGKCLEVLTKRAQAGSVSHLTLFFDLMERTEAKLARTLSIQSGASPNPKLLEQRALWFEQSVGEATPDPGQDSESKPDPGPGDKVGSDG